jgi:hypothetical protein
MARKCAAAAKSKSPTILFVVFAIAVVVIGFYLTLREGWASPSSGRVSGPEGIQGPPYSERQLLLPYPNYEYSTRSAAPPKNQQFYVKNRLSNNPNYLYSHRPDLAVPTFQPSAEYRRIGIVYDPERPERKFPLFGRPTYLGGNRFDYYILDDTIHMNPLPLINHNGLELVSGNRVRFHGYPHACTVYVYYE